MRCLAAVVVLAVCWSAQPGRLQAQYFRFGKNKVQYDDQRWSYLQSKHFDVYYYDDGHYLADFTAKAAEEAYQELRRLFQYDISDRIPIIVYQSHNDFAVTNAVDLPTYSEGIGGVTEPYKNRIAIPFVGDYRDYRKTLHHELVHAMINDIYYGGSFQSIIQNNVRLRIPHWFNEGLAEYAAEGWSTDADEWIRDAVIHDNIPPIPYLSGFASYQAGQGLWDYIAEQYGREKIGEILQRLRLTHSVEGSFRRATGLSFEELSAQWLKTLKKIHYPELSARDDITEIARPLITRENGGLYNTSPALSYHGDKLAFITTRNGLFDVYIADANDGTILQKLVDGQTSAEYESLRILTPGLSWSPDSRRIALAVKSGPSDAIAVIDIESHEAVHYRIPDVDQIVTVAWSPQGDRIAFEASMNGRSDIFVLDLTSRQTVNYTNDVFSDHEPAWSPDGKALLFHSDRGAHTRLGRYDEARFDMIDHDFGQFDVYLLRLDESVATRLTFDEQWDDLRGRFGSDPDRVLFISDRNGISNLYEKRLSTGAVRPLTDVVIGLTQVALSANGQKAALVSLEDGTPQIYLMTEPFGRTTDTEVLRPSVWAQRVMQETLIPAPALVLASNDQRRKNPFLRDATDGVAYARPPRRTPAGARSPLLARLEERDRRAGREGRDETSASRPPPDTARFGSVRIDFRDYIFDSDAERPERDDDLESFIDPFNPSDNVDDDGRYKGKKYKLSFSPDLVYGTAGYDALFGMQGITQMSFSDILGNHRVFVATNLLIDLRNSDYVFAYTFLPRRVDWRVSGFHVSRLLRDNRQSTIYRYRQYGASLTASYPLDKFRRVDFDLSVVGVSQADIIEPSIPAVTRTLLYPSITFTRDVTTPGLLAPLSGTRYSFRMSGSPFGFNQAGVRFITLLADSRAYTSFGQGLYSFAVRGSGGLSLGPTQQLFYTAGVQNWLNRHFDNTNGFPIEDISDFIFATPIVPLRGYAINTRSGTNFALVNAEFRFPLVAALLPGPLPLIPLYNIQGTAFVDMGAVWGGRGLNNPFNVFREDAAGHRVFDDMLVSTGFGLRTILLGYPFRVDMAWPFDGRRFHDSRVYLSVGIDF